MNERAHTSKLSPSIYDAPLFFFLRSLFRRELLLRALERVRLVGFWGVVAMELQRKNGNRCFA